LEALIGAFCNSGKNQIQGGYGSVGDVLEKALLVHCRKHKGEKGIIRKKGDVGVPTMEEESHQRSRRKGPNQGSSKWVSGSLTKQGKMTKREGQATRTHLSKLKKA